MKHIYIFLIVILLATFPLIAQIIPSAPVDPFVDGSLGANEYPIIQQLRDMRLGYALSKDSQTLIFALEAPTTGWVSVGLGSNRMNGAHMIIGFDAISNQVISEETGRGHSHKPSSTNILTKSMIKEDKGKTTLEFSVPASLYTSGRNLRLIVAYGSQDNLSSKHSRHDSHTITFNK